MAARQITPPTDAEVARLVVLGALCRGMTVSYAARTAGITKPEVAAIADAAGWPDVPAVQAVYEALRAAKRKSGPKSRNRPAAPVVPVVPPPPPPVVRARPAGPRPDLSVARVAPVTNPVPVIVAMCGLCNVPLKDCAGHYPVPPDELVEEHREFAGAVGEMLERAKQEYFGEVVQTGPTPGHRELLADYVARVAEPIEAALTAELQLPPGHRLEFDTTPLLEFDETRPETYPCAQPGGDCGCTGTGLLACPGRTEDYDDALIEDEAARTAPSPSALPPATDSPARPAVKRSATRPGTLPCEGCGRGVTREYAERTGVQRHGHCREGS